MDDVKTEQGMDVAWPPVGFVDRDGACAMFGVALRTWTQWQKSGKVRGVRRGRHRLYTIGELDRLREQNRLATEPRPDTDRPGCWRVPVISGKFEGMAALIDAESLPLVRGARLNWSAGKREGGSVLVFLGAPTRVPLHHLVLGVRGKENRIAHLNGDPLDCRRENLVVRTYAEERAAAPKIASRLGRACTSRYKGVAWHAIDRIWTSGIRAHGKPTSLGRFRDEVLAALAYDEAAREVFGTHARLNFPDGVDPEIAAASAARAAELEPPPFPAGMVDRHGACEAFGIALGTWVTWERNGRIGCHQWFRRSDGKRIKMYALAELERLREEFERMGKPYPDPDRPGVWRVPLKSYLARREALIDEGDLPIVQGKNWNWSGRSDEGKTEGNVILATVGQAMPLHRMILGLSDPSMRSVRVSFANGDALDCRRANLLTRTNSEVSSSCRKMETRAGKKCTSTFKGVSWDASREKWHAQINTGPVHTYIGRFDSETDAALAYDAAARVRFGAHAHLNLPDQMPSEQAMADARAALEKDSNRTRLQRRRQRDIERGLRRAQVTATASEGGSEDGETLISFETARQLFDATPNVWLRWQRFGWLPTPAAGTSDGQAMVPLMEIDRLLRQCGIVALPYPDPQNPGVYRVPLSGETGGGREALIDADAVTLVQTTRWQFGEKDAGRGGEIKSINPHENIRLHYVVMGITGKAEDFHIGHRNDDPFDCRRDNLVVRTFTESAANKRKQTLWCGQPVTSRFKGVCMPKRSKLWLATITKERRQQRLGTFRDEIAAAQAYDEAARELFGEHARLNFPDGVDAYLAKVQAAEEPTDIVRAAA